MKKDFWAVAAGLALASFLLGFGLTNFEDGFSMMK